ncbi:polysaccharide pyruvyl transferase family protein [Pseudothauera rhizosphaerae]|uniref:Polysaccharide pyruvyl transferase family protein n=1 Tax=Pseudothauera rhizosphaerae TaxID=2565932 RepID=A0A4S4AB58_9RHOO|nr:polysaccharide pyruvyl transferase family protein [Pseudothauera rhizosphaerae]THF56180.1 polysaccharide pyruvyl transferase family protein [Pseudothauera rhizosphaerae]
MHHTQSLLRIAFITTVDRNPGDAFIRAGIEYLIQQHIPYYRGIYVDKHEYLGAPTQGGGGSLFASMGRLLGKGEQGTEDPFLSADLVVQAGTPFYYIVPDADGAYESFSSSLTTGWIGEVWLKRLFCLSSPPPLLNLAVGTCQPFFSDALEFEHSPALLDFIRRTVDLSRLTTVREKVAERLLERCGLQTHCLPCTAIFAADCHRIYPEKPRFVCLNYMEGGAHYNLGQKIDSDGWQRAFQEIHRLLSGQYPVVVMCHSPGEVLKVRSLLPDADTFFSPNYEDYLHMYAKARFGVVNRAHSAMVLAGLGRPAVVVGNDTRVRMAELMELPVTFVNEATTDRIIAWCTDFAARPDAWRERLCAIKVASREKYLQLLGACLEDIVENVQGGEGYLRSDSTKTVHRR